MKVSLNTIKQYIDFALPPTDELVARINARLGGVEEVIDMGAMYQAARIVKVVRAEKHPDADRLYVVQIDDGGAVSDVPRDDDGLVQVVCGAPNVRAGMFAVWLPPHSTVPSSVGTDEPFVLEARKLRGVLSQGMLAAGDELALNNDHEGIIEIDPNEWKPGDRVIVPGASFAEVYGLDDTIIDIENKMFTHRPDLFGQLGVAREIAGIFGHAFTSPTWYTRKPEFSNADECSLEVFNDVPDKAPRFMAVVMKDIEVKPSPLWLQCELARLGGKPINNIVDVTNYVMLLTAQPTHAYDYDKLEGKTLGVRMAHDGETALLLNDKTYELTTSDIVIADGSGVVGLAGIMGGGTSEVSAETKNIVLEVANFDMYTVRKSSMRHGLFTDALTRFNKGQSPLQNARVMHLLMQSILDVSSGAQASDVMDLRASEHEHQEPIVETTHFVNQRLGLDLSSDEMMTVLKNVELQVSEEDGSSHPHPQAGDYPVLIVEPPFWRTDLELPEDIVEEVGRLYGFDKLPRELPARSIIPAPHAAERQAERAIRQSLSRAGANEVLTYSFVHKNLLKKVGQSVDKAFALSNALSPDLQYYRLSLLPSLLDKTYGNIRAGYNEFGLFEIGKVHGKGELDQAGLPKEFNRVALVYTADKKTARTKSGAPYFMAKRLASELYHDTSSQHVRFEPLKDSEFLQHEMFAALAAPFDHERAAIVFSGEALAGVVGEFTADVRLAFKLADYTAGFELFLSPFLQPHTPGYQPLSKFPSTTQDISLKVAATVAYADVVKSVGAAMESIELDDVALTWSPIGIYAPDGDTSTKTITLRLKVTSFERTLTDADVAPLIAAAAKAAEAAVGAQLS